MATASPRAPIRGNPGYPTSSPQPMPETDHHRNLMFATIDTVDVWFASDPLVYVSGNILIFYVPGNKRRHISPDVLVVKGVPKGERLNYLVWEEGKAPDLALELTSSSTRSEDVKRKFHIYQDLLRIPEYFLFDPFGDYLDPLLQGYRLRRGKYAAIRALKRRLPSQVLDLHFEAADQDLPLYNPATQSWLPTYRERVAQAELARQQADMARQAAEAEAERLRREIEALRRSRNGR
jgi:Uma2 family endonuclease